MAASKTLPLGTTAKVIDLQNGKSATVRVEDRGAFVAGRVMDVTFRVTQELDIRKHGVVPVEVKPIAVPQPSGELKFGAGAADLTPQRVSGKRPERLNSQCRSIPSHRVEDKACFTRSRT